MLSDKKPVSTRIAKSLSYSSYFEQTIEEESRRLATGKQRQKQKQKPRINTEISRSISHENKTLLSEPDA